MRRLLCCSRGGGHREEDHVHHAGDSHEATDDGAEEECPWHPTQQNAQTRCPERDEEAGKGHESRREFCDRAELGEPVRECLTETHEEPGESSIIFLECCTFF